MCIPEKDECPINDVKIDLTSKYNEYISNQYKMACLNKLDEGYSLYYTNKVTENNIIVKFKFVNSEGEKPRYINEDNFIFDDDTYKKSITILEKEEAVEEEVIAEEAEEEVMVEEVEVLVAEEQEEVEASAVEEVVLET